MFSTIAAFALGVLWAFAWATSHTYGGLIHLLPFVAAMLFLNALFREAGKPGYYDF